MIHKLKLKLKGDINLKTNYYWIRLFDYNYERDEYEKGTLLEEFYLKDILGGRDEVRKEIYSKYDEDFNKSLKFAKPRKKDGVYALVMDSSKFFYDRFYVEIDTLCFDCHKPIKGKAAEFPRGYIGGTEHVWFDDPDLSDLEKTSYFCDYNCKNSFSYKLRKDTEGEFQQREEGRNGEVFGYIYEIYNRAFDKYYVGQTRYLPFFRWQEHVKDGSKGLITDLSFRVITEVNKSKDMNIDDQKYLNNIESWWIQKYKEEGKDVFNITVPKITLSDMKEKFKQMINNGEI
jgi:hypothetical protein